MRVLGVIRQSKKRELSESPTTQRMAIEQWAALNGHVIIDWAEDVGVSASVAPDRRPQLKPWLTDPHKLASWDIMAAWKVDRVVRSLKHFYGELYPMLEPLGKHVAAVTEGINTATSSALEIAMRVTIAQEELTKMKDRARESRARLREGARWHGGVPWYGYRPVKTATGVKLAIDEEELTVLNVMIDMLRDGGTINACTTWLNRESVLTTHDRHKVRMGRKPKGAPWYRTTLLNMLTSRCLLGQMTHGSGDEADVERNAEGVPLQYGEPLMDRADWDQLQEVIANSKGSGKNYTNRGPGAPRRASSAPLLRIAYCNWCGAPMYHRPANGRDVRRYYCSSRIILGRDRCPSASFKADILESIVTELYLERFGAEEIVTVEAVATIDHASKIRELDENVANLVGALERLNAGPVRDVAVSRLNTLTARRAEHESALNETQGVKTTRTGRTYAQEWEAATAEIRIGLLRKHRVYAMVQRAEAGLPNFVGVGMGGPASTYTTVTFADRPGMDGRRGLEVAA